ncbi:hypothetical protein [Actinoplanes philippinensis]
MIVLFPEPRYVFGPDRPRGVPAADAEIPAIVDDHTASEHRVKARTGATE